MSTKTERSVWNLLRSSKKTITRTITCEDFMILTGTPVLAGWLYVACPFCEGQHRSLTTLLRCRGAVLRKRHGVCAFCNGRAGWRRPRATKTWTPMPIDKGCVECGDSGARLTPAQRKKYLPDWLGMNDAVLYPGYEKLKISEPAWTKAHQATQAKLTLQYKRYRASRLQKGGVKKKN